MVDDAMAAYTDEDVEACFAINERDDEVDRLCEGASGAVVRDLIETGASGEGIEDLMNEISRLLLTIATSSASATTPSTSPPARYTWPRTAANSFTGAHFLHVPAVRRGRAEHASAAKTWGKIARTPSARFARSSPCALRRLDLRPCRREPPRGCFPNAPLGGC
jgi:hypothetical protein